MVEVVLVLVLLGVLAALAAPSLGGWLTRWRMASALDRFQSELWYARALAARGGTRVELRFDPATAVECVQRYRVVVLAEVERIAREIEPGNGLCLRQNRDVPIRIDGRGVPTTSAARSVWIRRGEMVDSLTVSVLGGINRRP